MKKITLLKSLLVVMALSLFSFSAIAETVTLTTFSATSGDMDAVISYETAQGGGTTAPAINNGVIRLYQNNNGGAGGEITIHAKSGYVIDNVVIGSAMKTSIAYTIGTSTVKSESHELAEGGKYTATVSDNAITFYCMGADKNSRLYVNYLSVTYAVAGEGGGSGNEGGEEPTPDPEEPVVPEVGDESTIFLANFNASGEYQSNSGSNDYINNHSYTVSGVVFNLKNCESAVSGSPLEGAAHIIARVAKNTTNTPTVETEAVTVKGSAITNIGFMYKAKTEGATMNVYTSPASGAETWTSIYSVKPTTALSRVDLPVSLSDDIKLKFEWVVTSSTSSNRDYYLDSIYVKGTKPEGMVEKPIITPATKDCLDPIEVTISAEAGEIRYTLNGEEPTAESTLYTAPFTVSSTTTVKAVAIVNGKLSEVAEATYTFPTEVANIAALIADASGKNVRINGAVTVLAQTGKYLWVKDASASMLVYGTAPAEYNNGDQLIGLVGKVSTYSGAKQIVPTYFPTAIQGVAVEPTIMALADVTAEKVHQYIKLEGVTYTNATTLTAGDKTLTMYNNRFNYTYAGEEGDIVNVIAIAGLYNSTVQIYPISIEKYVAPTDPTSVENTKLSDIYTLNRTIVAEGEFQIFTITGQNVTDMNGNLEKGIYVVRTTNATAKVVIK